jgi:hypothetical protein
MERIPRPVAGTVFISFFSSIHSRLSEHAISSITHYLIYDLPNKHHRGQPPVRITIRHNLNGSLHPLQTTTARDLNPRHAEIAQSLFCEGWAHDGVEC